MRRSLFPAVLLALGLSLLIGCLYIPTGSRRIGQHQADFRSMVGQRQGAVIRPGYVNRETVLQMLGRRPPFFSADGSAVGYALDTQDSYWVYPLCFFAENGHQALYVLRLDFRPDGRLDRYAIASVGHFEDPFWVSMPQSETDDIAAALRKLNRSGPPLLWSGRLGG